MNDNRPKSWGDFRPGDKVDYHEFAGGPVTIKNCTIQHIACEKDEQYPVAWIFNKREPVSLDQLTKVEDQL
jgi:hypothetical protein